MTRSKLLVLGAKPPKYNALKMQKATAMFLDALGDKNWRKDENTKETPLRVAKMYGILLGGNDIDNESHVKVFQSTASDMVTLSNVPFYSFCAHHLLPFVGKLHIAYIPNGKVLGVSKLVRIARTHAKKLQLQEDLTNDIADDLDSLLQPLGVAVQVQSSHSCMTLRGVRSHGAFMTTTSLRGLMKDDLAARTEFLQAIQAKGDVNGY